ncbi:MAG: response regulator transcription factor, partial [Demequina sp.]
MSVSVVIVDDHDVIRVGVRESLDDEIQVVGEAHNVESAVAEILDKRPQVVILDVHLPGGQGGGALDVLADIKGRVDGTRVLALSVSDSAEDVVSVIRAGARGYVTKSISGPDLSDAVRRVA